MQVALKAENRTVLGRKVKKLRKDGKIPGHVFGRNVKTVHVSVEKKDFLKTYNQVGETGLVNLKIGASEERPVLVRNTQFDPLTDEVIHIDFFQVNLKEKVTANVPLEIIGEAPAVEQKLGVLLTPVTELEVEALPTDLPEKIEVDVSNLNAVDEAILVGDLKIPSGVEVKDDLEETVAKIGELMVEEEEPVVVEAAEGEEAAVEGEAGEAAPAEGEAAPASEDKVQSEE
ncbi:MAG TPA: 50S ribosomal protein L25 [Patescibacteria group bacterium]